MLLLSLPQRVWQYNAGCGPAVFMQQGCADALAAKAMTQLCCCVLYASTTTVIHASRGGQRGWLGFIFSI